MNSVNKRRHSREEIIPIQETIDTREYQVDVSYTDELDLRGNVKRCKKNKEHGNHEDFLLFSSLSWQALPQGFRNPWSLAAVRWLSMLTVKLEVNYASNQRPAGFGIDADLRGKTMLMNGSGSVIAVSVENNRCGTGSAGCLSAKCQDVQFCGYFVVATAAHVVFDDDEAASTSVVFFFHDNKNRNFLEKCHGVCVQTSNKKADFTELVCVTHNREFFKGLVRYVKNKFPFKESLYTYSKADFLERFLQWKLRSDAMIVPTEQTTPYASSSECYTYDYQAYFFPNDRQDELLKVMGETLTLERFKCLVTPLDQGVRLRVELESDSIDRFHLLATSAQTEQFMLLNLNNSLLVMGTEQYIRCILTAADFLRIQIYKGIFVLDCLDDGSTVFRRDTSPLPPAHILNSLHQCSHFSSLDSQQQVDIWLEIGSTQSDEIRNLIVSTPAQTSSNFPLVGMELLLQKKSTEMAAGSSVEDETIHDRLRQVQRALQAHTALLYEFVNRDSVGSEMLVVHISHPHGQAKHISLGTRTEIETDSGFYRHMYEVATCAGSSGGPVWFIPREALESPLRLVELQQILAGAPHSRHLGDNLNCGSSWTLYCPRVETENDDISDSYR